MSPTDRYTWTRRECISDDDEHDAPAVATAPVSIKLPIDTQVPFPQSVPVRMELPIHATLSLHHRPVAGTVAPTPDDAEAHHDEDEHDDTTTFAVTPAVPHPSERAMSRLVPRSPYWQAKQAAFIAQHRKLDEMALVRQEVQDLRCKVDKFEWPDTLQVETHLDPEDQRRLASCEAAVQKLGDQLQRQDTQISLTQAAVGRCEAGLKTCLEQLDAILRRLNAAPLQAAVVAPPVVKRVAAKKAASRAAAKKTGQP